MGQRGGVCGLGLKSEWDMHVFAGVRERMCLLRSRVRFCECV